ncbi:MAG: hypothetical protein AAF699_03705 [Pseudomonadota bacterium]
MISPGYRLAIFACAVYLVGLLIYAQGLTGPLVFDDIPWLNSNTLVQIDGLTADEWRAAALSSHSGPLRRPIAMTSFAANHAIAGSFSPWPLKLVNLSLHLMSSILLYPLFMAILAGLRLLPNTESRRLVAVTAAAIWFLHPLNVSTVLYVIQRMSILCTLFVITGLSAYAVYRQRWAESGATSGQVIALGLWLLVLTMLATFSKENGALLPFLVLAVEVAVFRGRWHGSVNRSTYRLAWFVLLLPLVAVACVLVFVPQYLEPWFSGREFTLWERVLTQMRILWFYLSWMIFPNIGEMGFHHDDIRLSTALMQPATTLLALLAWLMLIVLAWVLRNRFPLLFLAVLFFLVGHSMESSILPLEMAYEHRNYLPSIMLYLLLAYVVVQAGRSTQRLHVSYPVIGVLLILSVLLLVRVQNWSEEVRLAYSNVSNHPESARANHIYANALLRRAREDSDHQLSKQEREETLLVARHYYERIYQVDNRDLAALVMLLYLDSVFFTELQTQVDWRIPIMELLADRRLQPTDWNALDLFFDFATASDEMVTSTQVQEILDLLRARYPQSADVMQYQYLVQSSQQKSDKDLLLTLDRAQELAPSKKWIYLRKINQQAAVGDIAGVYDTARLWLLNDPQRYHVNELKTLFSAQREEQYPTDD